MNWKNIFRALLIVLLCHSEGALAQLVSDNAFLQGHWLEVAVAPNGSWGNTVTVPSGYHTHTGSSTGGYTDPVTLTTATGNGMDFSYDAGHDGWAVGAVPFYGAYFLPGTPFDGWMLQVDGVRSDAFYSTPGFWNAAGGTLTGSVTGYTSAGGTMTGIWSGSAGPGSNLKITQYNRLDTEASWLVVTTVFKNMSGAAMPGVYYFVSADPDNDEVISGGSFATVNRITFQNDADHRVMVGSYATDTAHHAAYSALCTKDCRAKAMIYSSWSPYPSHTTSLDAIYGGHSGLGTVTYTADSTTSNQDWAYALIYNIGTINAGDSAVISYAWVFKDSICVDSAFPEPLLVVNNSAIAPSGPAPAPTIDTFKPCDFSVTSVPVRIDNATDKCWTWSSWTWAPSTGLASTTGVTNTINVSSLSGVTTYTITGTDSAVDMYSCNRRIMYLTIIPCFNATNNSTICAGDTLKLAAHGDSTGATYAWYGPGWGGPVVATGQFANVTGTTTAMSGTYYVIKTVGGSSDTASTVVTINAVPAITATSNAPICSGNTLTLTSSPDSVGETWSWTGPGGYTSAASDPTRPGALTAYSGVYSVLVTFHACTNMATVTVEVDSTPAVPAISSNSPVCSGDTLKLFASDATAGVGYSWSGPGGFASAAQNPIIGNVPMPANGTYTVTARLGTCTNAATTVVVVHPTPQPVLTSNGPVCSGTTLTLTETDTLTGSTFAWSGPDSFTSTVHNPSISPATTAATGTYSVVVTNNGCSSVVKTIYAEVDSTPVVPTVGSNSPVCSGNTLFLTSSSATAGVSYQWAGPGAYTSAIQNPSIINVPMSANGTYTATATLGACSSSATTVATINLTPATPALTSNSPVCSGNPLAFTASSTAGSTYQWTGPLGFNSTLQNPTIDPAITLNTGIYSVVATLNGCNSAMATIYAEADTTPQLPVASTNSPGAPGATICQGDTLKLFGSSSTSGVGYSWSGPNSFTSTDANPIITDVSTAANGAYTLTVTVGSCVAQAVITATITPTPPLSATSNSPVCTGDTLHLTAVSNAGAVFTWTGPYTFSSGAQAPSRQPVVAEYGGVYTVSVLYDGCTNVVTTVVDVHVTPGPPWMAWLTYCQNYPAPALQAYGDNILWYPSSATGATGSPAAPVPATTAVGSTYYYASQTIAGCESTVDSMLVTVVPAPKISIDGNAGICPHDTAILMATELTGQPVSYHWYPQMYLHDSTSDTVVTYAETNMNYYAVVTNQYGCKDTGWVEVTVHPAAIISLTDSVTLYPGETYQISPETNCSSFRWSPAGGLSGAFISNPIASPGVSTEYFVTAQTEYGCKTRDSILIHIADESVLDMPNAFTPGSSVNNQFKVILRGIASLKSFRVYDRWGVVVFQTTDITQGWDGTYKGTPQPFGVYVYQVEAVTSGGQEVAKKGNVTLIR